MAPPPDGAVRLNEDEIYRSSTQYRLWSFTPEKLASLRKQTNVQATERVKAAVKRLRASRSNGTNTPSEGQQNGANGHATEKEVECLTLEEEQKIVEYYTARALELGQHLKFPINVTATAIQYMKRFYLTNSPMTYQPKDIMRSALFLATKTENWHTPLRDFAANIPKTTPESVLAPEFLVTQALRFTFDVRHPHRGLSGGHMEMLAILHGQAAVLPALGKSSAQLQQDMLRLPKRPGDLAVEQSVVQMEKRVGQATGEAGKMLKNAAVLSDAYFLFTPSQIWLSAYLLVDEPLALFYLSTKLPESANASKLKIIEAIRKCATLLTETQASQDHTPREELVRIEKKLYQCRDPDKMDLVGLHAAQKRGVAAEGAIDENFAKKRKLEREKADKEADEFWGPELKK